MAIWLALIVWEITYVLLLQAIVFCFALRFDFQFGVSTSLWLLVLVYIDKEISLKRTKSSNDFNRAWMNCRGWKSEIGIWRSGRDQRILAKDSLTRAFLLIHLSSKTITLQKWSIHTVTGMDLNQLVIIRIRIVRGIRTKTKIDQDLVVAAIGTSIETPGIITKIEGIYTMRTTMIILNTMEGEVDITTHTMMLPIDVSLQREVCSSALLQYYLLLWFCHWTSLVLLYITFHLSFSKIVDQTVIKIQVQLRLINRDHFLQCHHPSPPRSPKEYPYRFLRESSHY